MKSKLIFIVLLFCSCTNNNFSGHVYDYDSDKPIKNVYININGNTTQTDSSGYFSAKVNSNAACILYLRREGYATKKVWRKADSKEKSNTRSLKTDRIYMFKKDSDFSK